MVQDAVSLTADGSLVIGYIERKHHGTYICTATNDVGTISAVAQVTVEGTVFINRTLLFEPRHEKTYLPGFRPD